MNYFYLSKTKDGYRNLAFDEWFVDNAGEDDLVFYLYINANAVIIGKNQNPFKECDLSRIESDGVQVVRRITGGGAVYHDSGNLNFSFIAGKNRYDKDRNFKMICSALTSLGIPAEKSGRNDIEVSGRKFSGNAFCKKGENFQHHGTLLISSDLNKLQNYLTVDERKIKSKGIDSVRARVTNLSEIVDNISVEGLIPILRKAFEEEFGETCEFVPDDKTKLEIEKYYEKHRSWEWRIGTTPKFDIEFDERFPFGGVQIFLSLSHGMIESCTAFSDSLDENISEKITSALTGQKFDPKIILERFYMTGDEKLCDIGKFMSEKIGG